MNRDRGVIKWTSLMLPEHVKQLKDLAKKQEKKTPPSIDAQQYEEWNRMLTNAYCNKEKIVATYIKNGVEEEIEGFIHRIDPINHCLVLTDGDYGVKTTVFFHELTNICLR